MSILEMEGTTRVESGASAEVAQVNGGRREVEDQV